MSEAWLAWHTAKSCVYFFLSCDLKTPVDKMVFEDPFVKLMEDIGGKTCKYVGMWKVRPEWMKHRSNPFFCKGSNSTPTSLMFKNDFGMVLISF